MILKQYYLDCLSHASYLVADEGTRRAVVVDPQRDTERYEADLTALGLRLERVILTHVHADFLAGHLELERRTGARIALGAAAQVDYDHDALKDGDILDLGGVRLAVLETPGHTPESICLLVLDPDDAPDRPHAILTGDTLFIGDVGRPDLMASVGVTAEDLAGRLYDSLRAKILPLPDETLVYPTHGAGSACGRNLGTETFAPLGAQRHSNWALQPMPRAEFIRLLVQDQPPAPAYFGWAADLNRRVHPPLADGLEAAVRPLPLDEVLRLQADGAQILDTRPATEFAAGHLAGSVQIGLDGRFASWAGVVLDPRRPIVLVTAPGAAPESAMRLGRIGFDRVVGSLAGGASALAARADLVRRVERLSADALRTALAAGDPPVVVDVRSASERAGGRIEGSLHIPLESLGARRDELPSDRPIVLHCRTGYRSMIAASLLESRSRTRVADLDGGMLAWQGNPPGGKAGSCAVA